MPSIVQNFWSAVLKALITEYSFSRGTARKLVSQHRNLITNDGVGDALLHFGPKDFAESIHERFAKKRESIGQRSVAAVASSERISWITFIKRLSANDAGDTGSHQGGSVYIPKDAEKFFPPLRGSKNPSSTILVKFREMAEPVTLRFVFYRPHKDDRRLTPLPPEIMKGTHKGDFLVLRKLGEKFEGAVVRKSDTQHTSLEKEVGSKIYLLRDDDFNRIFAKRGT